MIRLAFVLRQLGLLLLLSLLLGQLAEVGVLFVALVLCKSRGGKLLLDLLLTGLLDVCSRRERGKRGVKKPLGRVYESDRRDVPSSCSVSSSSSSSRAASA